MGLFNLTSDSSGSSVGSTYSEPPLQEVAQPAWKERKGLLGEWSVALIIAFIAALTIRTFFFEAFRIPSESMEDTLVVGDFVLVSKMHYGSRVPTTIGIPFTAYYLDSITLPRLRLPGFAKVEHNDVIVFNVPGEVQPIDRKTHYIKRVIALPGDTLRIQNKVPLINGEPLRSGDNIKYMWKAHPFEGKEVPHMRLKELGVYQMILPQRQGDPLRFEASQVVSKEVEAWPEVERVEPVVKNSHFREKIFPTNSGFSLDQYGPLYVPKKGDTIELNDKNWVKYKEIITRYEGNTGMRVGEDTYHLNGSLARFYTLNQDYFFVMGDNRDSSLDSRTWGFVPFDHVVGKAITVYFSWDAQAGQIRKGRILKKLN